jgi:ubiquinol-cytochrome c reductase cytochrome c1 subunit
MIKALCLGWLLLTNVAYAEEIAIELAKAPVNIYDTASIKRGAKYFSTICIACHTLIYLRYDKIAADAGITLEKMPINVKTWPNNVKPPDLSLEADVRGVDWIYTYLHSFYVDPKRPTGTNNLVHPDTAMLNMVGAFQGVQVLAPVQKKTDKLYDKKLQWYDVLELQKQGSMTPAEFDQAMTDVVNFLQYAANPFQVEQERLGKWVLGFLFILIILTYLLKREYWKEVKKE